MRLKEYLMNLLKISQEVNMTNVEAAKNLFSWNKKNLIASARINKIELEDLFASSFKVIANGRKYEANYDNYLEFLNQFRSNIKM
jgi:hypothetical protein